MGTLLDRLHAAGRAMVSVGKIGDIFAHRHTGEEIKPSGNDGLPERGAIDAMHGLGPGGLVFANLVDFDSDYGHRRDLPGYGGGAGKPSTRRVPEIEGCVARK